jgi:hypothetical protein
VIMRLGFVKENMNKEYGFTSIYVLNVS